MTAVTLRGRVVILREEFGGWVQTAQCDLREGVAPAEGVECGVERGCCCGLVVEVVCAVEVAGDAFHMSEAGVVGCSN